MQYRDGRLYVFVLRSSRLGALGPLKTIPGLCHTTITTNLGKKVGCALPKGENKRIQTITTGLRGENNMEEQGNYSRRNMMDRRAGMDKRRSERCLKRRERMSARGTFVSTRTGLTASTRTGMSTAAAAAVARDICAVVARDTNSDTPRKQSFRTSLEQLEQGVAEKNITRVTLNRRESEVSVPGAFRVSIRNVSDISGMTDQPEFVESQQFVPPSPHFVPPSPPQFVPTRTVKEIQIQKDPWADEETWHSSSSSHEGIEVVVPQAVAIDEKPEPLRFSVPVAYPENGVYMNKQMIHCVFLLGCIVIVALTAGLLLAMLDGGDTIVVSPSPGSVSAPTSTPTSIPSEFAHPPTSDELYDGNENNSGPIDADTTLPPNKTPSPTEAPALPVRNNGRTSAPTGTVVSIEDNDLSHTSPPTVASQTETPVSTSPAVTSSTFVPTTQPSYFPTTDDLPSVFPTLQQPTSVPTDTPTSHPTHISTDTPTSDTSDFSTHSPTLQPTSSATNIPTPDPSGVWTGSPTSGPSKIPTDTPTPQPTYILTDSPTLKPANIPTDSPTAKPAELLTGSPTLKPTPGATDSPTLQPADISTESPTLRPATLQPTSIATDVPTAKPGNGSSGGGNENGNSNGNGNREGDRYDNRDADIGVRSGGN